MKKLLLLPTFLLTMAVKPFLGETHPWKDIKITLSSWAEHATPLNKAIAWNLWVSAICLPIAAFIIFCR